MYCIQTADDIVKLFFSLVGVGRSWCLLYLIPTGETTLVDATSLQTVAYADDASNTR